MDGSGAGISVECGGRQINVIRDHDDQQHGQRHHAENEHLPRFEIPPRQHALFFARAGALCQSPEKIFSLCNALQLCDNAAEGGSFAVNGNYEN